MKADFKLGVYIDKSDHICLRVTSTMLGMSIKDFVIEAIREKIERSQELYDKKKKEHKIA